MMIPCELHLFLLGVMSADAFRTWLYAAPELVEPWLSPADYLAVLEIDYDDRPEVTRLRERLSVSFVPLPPRAFTPQLATTETDHLLNAIRSAPDDPQNYLVLGDYLQMTGDPRGELIALHASAMRGASYFVARDAGGLFENHGHALLGPALAYADSVLKLDWFLGFVARATVLGDSRAMRALFSGHPSFALLREVILKRDERNSSLEVELDVLANAPESSLSVLRIHGWEHRYSRNALGDLSRLWAAHPRLRVLELEGNVEVLGESRLPELLVLKMHADGNRANAMAEQVFEMAWPLLERFEVLIEPSDEDEDDSRLELPSDLERVMPRLRHLVLRTVDSDSFWEQVPASRAIQQLESLEIDLSGLGVQMLRDHAERFRNIKILLLKARTPLRTGEAAELKKLLPHAIIR